jgi:hypothetical protein
MTSTADPRDSDPGESEAERVQRNWTEILQELRVIQTGSQILTGFLLTLAFQPRFADLDALQRTLYLALVATAALTTILGLAPVSLHRTLFRQGAKETIVRVADIVMKITLAAVGFTLAGTVVLIFDVVMGRAAALIAGGGALVVILVAWITIPAISLRRLRD